MDVQLSQRPDQLCWKLTRNGQFTVKSMYIDVINSTVIPSTKHVWKVKVPLKIKVFMWFVHKQVILTKDNLLSAIGQDLLGVVSVIGMKPSSIYSLSARWQGFCDAQCKLLLTLLLRVRSGPYLERGWIG